jgi:WD40 repeat protein
VVGLMTGGLRIYDADDGSLRTEAPGHPDDAVHSVAVSPDGTWIVTGHISGMIRIWDTDANERASFPGMVAQPPGLGGLAISPDGTWIAAGGAHGVRLLTPDGREHATLADPPQGVHSVAISPDGTWLAAGGQEGVRAWSADGRDRFGQNGPWPVYTVAISPDGSRLAAGASTSFPGDPSTGIIRVLDPGGTPLTELRTQRHVLRCAWFPDSAVLCVAGGIGIQRFTVEPPPVPESPVQTR